MQIDIERVLDFIRDNAHAYAKAKAEAEYLESYRKTVKAQVMQRYHELSVAAQEREAYASQEVQDIDKAIRIATEEAIRLQWLLEAARIKAETWRSLEASNRATDRAHL